MPRKNTGLFFSVFVTKVCLTVPPWKPGIGLQLDSTESPQVISFAKSKYLHIFGIFFLQTLNCHYSSTVRAFDLIPKLRARPEYFLSSDSKYTA